MAEAKTAVANKPVWADLSSPDAEGSRKFYSKLFGWNIEVNPDPQYGGYGMARIAGKDVAGVGGQKLPGGPPPRGPLKPAPPAAGTAQKSQTPPRRGGVGAGGFPPPRPHSR